MRSIALLLSVIFCLGNTDGKTTRRGLFKKIRDAYIEGRLSANEKRIAKRKEKEKVRRRLVFERNVKTLVKGISKRLKHKRSTVSLIVIGSVVLVVWLCHKGSLGCERAPDTLAETPQGFTQGSRDISAVCVPSRTIQLGAENYD